MTRHKTLELALGCVAVLSIGAVQPARAQTDCALNPNSLIIYHAGSIAGLDAPFNPPNSVSKAAVDCTSSSSSPAW